MDNSADSFQNSTPDSFIVNFLRTLENSQEQVEQDEDYYININSDDDSECYITMGELKKTLRYLNNLPYERRQAIINNIIKVNFKKEQEKFKNMFVPNIFYTNELLDLKLKMNAKIANSVNGFETKEADQNNNGDQDEGENDSSSNASKTVSDNGVEGNEDEYSDPSFEPSSSSVSSSSSLKKNREIDASFSLNEKKILTREEAEIQSQIVYDYVYQRVPVFGENYLRNSISKHYDDDQQYMVPIDRKMFLYKESRDSDEQIVNNAEIEILEPAPHIDNNIDLSDSDSE